MNLFIRLSILALLATVSVGCATPAYYTRPVYAPPAYGPTYYSPDDYGLNSYAPNYYNSGYYAPRPIIVRQGPLMSYPRYGAPRIYRQPANYGRTAPAPRMMYQRRFGR